MNVYKILSVIFLLFTTLTLQGKEHKVFIQLDWLHQFQFAGYYMAKEKGYFKDENLDVTIKEFDNNVNLVDNVLNSEAIYSVGKSSLIIDRLEGKKIVFISAIYQNSPLVLISLDKSNIKTVKDLKNKKVMLTSDARSAAAINSMIISQGLKLSDINFQKHFFNLENLLDGTTDAMGCYLSNEPYFLKSNKIKFTIHNPSNYGFKFYGGLFFTSQKELINNPIRVRKMHKAILKGWNYAFNNIDETVETIYKKYNPKNKPRSALRYEAEVLKNLSEFDKGNLGKIELKKIEEIKRLYLLLGLSKSIVNFKLEDLIYNPKKIYLTKEEKEYIKNNQINLILNTNLPYFSMDIDGELSGIEVDYWYLIRKKLKLNSKIIFVDSDKEANKKIDSNLNNIKFYNKPFELKFHINKNNKILSSILNKAVSSISNEEKKLIHDKYIKNKYKQKKDYFFLYLTIGFILILITLIIIYTKKLREETKKRELIEEESKYHASIDPLTKTFNKMKIISLLKEEIDKKDEYKKTFCVIVFNINDFKLINYKFDYIIGDTILIKVARLVKESLRKKDYFGRWEWDKFIIILPDTNRIEAKNIAYLLKEKIINFDFKINTKITCNFIISKKEETDSHITLLNRVNKAATPFTKYVKNEVKIV